MSKPDQQSLTPRQERFVANYLKTGNAKRAAIAAGYKPNYAHSQSGQTLQVPAVKAKLEQCRMEIHKKDIISIEYKLQYLKDGMEYYASVQEWDKGAKLCEVANKIQGHNAPEQINTNLLINDKTVAIKQLTEQLLVEPTD